MTHHTHTQNEEWRPVVGYEKRYEVSNFGRVRTIERLVLYPEIKNNLKAWADARYLKFLESNNVSDPEFRPSAI